MTNVVVVVVVVVVAVAVAARLGASGRHSLAGSPCPAASSQKPEDRMGDGVEGTAEVGVEGLRFDFERCPESPL